ncbi:MAG: D-amino acid aminotransferase [Betaproteobacteria bacterium]|nr:D-amino acid aminotransferase [Betaproteobacteria bacterium]
MIYLNGEFLPLEEARIPVLDRGFIFGDGVYEVIPVYGRRPFRLSAHLARLDYSLAGIRLANPCTHERWGEIIAAICAKQAFDDQAVYLQITRGVAKRDHSFPAGVAPTVFLMSNPLPLPSAEQIAHGVAAITAPDDRWRHCDLKTTSLLGNVLLRQLAVDQGAAETILFREGLLTEGSAANALIVQDGRIIAPKKDWRILPGITYGAVYDFANEARLPFEMRDIPEAEVRAAAEVWLSSSTKEVLAVTRLDGAPVGSGTPGPIFRQMHALFKQARGVAG